MAEITAKHYVILNTILFYSFVLQSLENEIQTVLILRHGLRLGSLSNVFTNVILMKKLQNETFHLISCVRLLLEE